MTSGKTLPKLVFFGNERLVSGLQSTDTPILRGLIERGYPIVAIVAHYSDTQSRKGRPLEVAAIAAEHSIPLLTLQNPADIHDQLVSFGAAAGILAAYGRIIPQNIIDIFPHGIINIHPSLLPAYRGPTPIEAPILNGDTKSGVSIMNLAAKMDAGAIYAQREFTIEPTDTKFDLYHKASVLSAALLFETLPHILDSSLTPTPQDDATATYCSLLTKSDGLLDPQKMTATEADRRVRAFLGYPKTRLYTLGHTIIVTKAHIATNTRTPLDVVCSDGKYLAIDELIAPSGKKMNATAFLNGYAAG